MFEEEKEAVRRYLATLDGPTENFDPSPTMTEDIRYVIKGSAPLSGVRTGFGDMRPYWQAIGDNYSHMQLIVHELAALEDGRVFARLQSVGTASGDGEGYDQTAVYVFTVTDGKVSEVVKSYEDTASFYAPSNA
jgi:ketosteroid isomerase-like protein